MRFDAKDLPIGTIMTLGGLDWTLVERYAKRGNDWERYRFSHRDENRVMFSCELEELYNADIAFTIPMRISKTTENNYEHTRDLVRHLMDHASAWASDSSDGMDVGLTLRHRTLTRDMVRSVIKEWHGQGVEK